MDLHSFLDNPAKVYGLTFIFTIISAMAFALLLGSNIDLGKAISSALMVSIGLTASAMAINYQFAKLSWIHLMIDCGFHAVRFVAMAIIYFYFL
ncbi:MAG: hypothetical protein ACI9CE_003682 [Flavobacterium sp.]